MPFNLKNKDRINNLLEGLAELRYKEFLPVEYLDMWEDDGSIGNQSPQGEPMRVHQGFQWKGWDRYNWLTTHISIPSHWIDEEVVGLFDFGDEEGSGNNANFESLLYLNERPYQGMDGNHKEVFLEPKENGLELDLKFRVWSGLSGGGTPRQRQMTIVRAEIALLDHYTDELFYLAKMALETHDILEETNEYKGWLLNILVKTFQFLDYTEPRSESFYDSIKQAYEYLDRQLQGQGKPGVTVNMLGHTHIDVAWLWRLRHTREKCARSFSTVNRLMEKYPHYTFLQSQPQLYEYVKEDYPEIYAHIQKRVKEGRWEPSGAMWVECDCNVASGEAIVRQILVGKNFYKQEFDYDSEFLWLPDVFGYSWALPQILKKSGISTFMTTKISWNDMNKMPYDTFWWKGIDGSDVLAHFITTSDPGDDYYTYNGNTTASAIKSVWDNYSNKDMNKDLLISYGYGDGGGGPNRTMIKQIKAAAKIPGLPQIEETTATDYFRKLHRNIQENGMETTLPTWDGELYLEFHRGTYTSQGYNKKMNRFLEFKLREVEMISSLAEILEGSTYDKDRLLKAWKIVLCHQFHDILPGSSIREVYEDSHEEYEKAYSYIKEVEAKAWQALTQFEEGKWTIFNQGNFTRQASYVFIPMERVAAFEGKKAIVGDEVVETAWNQDGVHIEVPVIEAMSSKVLSFSKEEAKPSNSLKTEVIDTPYYKVRLDEFGRFASLWDKRAGREVLSEGKAGNVLQIFEDKPRMFDAWEMEATIDLKMEEIKTLTKCEVYQTALGVDIHLGWHYHKSQIDQVIRLYHHNPRIDFETKVDWQEHQKLLKVAFPVNIRATDARFDIQYGNIRRPITRNTSWEAAKFEVAAHKWVDLWETGYGVALMNNCKYGYDVKEDTIRLSLLKSAIDPDYNADNEVHEFTYALLPHSQEWYAADLEALSFDLNVPLALGEGVSKHTLEQVICFSGDNVVLDAFKKAENKDTYILRFHEYQGRRGILELTQSLGFTKWRVVDLMENPTGEVQEGVIELEVKPYEIITLELWK